MLGGMHHAHLLEIRLTCGVTKPRLGMSTLGKHYTVPSTVNLCCADILLIVRLEHKWAELVGVP